MFPSIALGANAGPVSGLLVNRTAIASQSTPTSIKTTDGVFYGLLALATGNQATPYYIQYFTSANSTLGVTAPTLEFQIPCASPTVTAGVVPAQSFNFLSPIGIPMAGGINIAASTAMSTGPAVSASTVVVYTLYA